MFEQLATMFRAFSNQPTSELEVSISLRSAGKQFVPKKIMKILKEKLPTFPGIVACTQVKYTDSFFPGNIRVRSRGMGHKGEAIIKTKLCSIHAKCAQKRHFDFHFTLKDEIPTEAPENAVPEFVRIQKVLEFQYKQAFCYFLKKVNSGPSVALACKEDPIYEVEIEVIPRSAYLLSHSHEEMADSLISKALGFIRESAEEDLTMELNIVPKSLKLLEPQRPKRKYISKKMLKEPKPKKPKKIKEAKEVKEKKERKPKKQKQLEDELPLLEKI
jgi:hypothetical protein